jgi:iron complex outermembrane receptor protein
MPITNANDHRTFAMFNVETRGFSLSTESVHRNFIPRPGQGGVRFHETSWAAQAKYARELRPALRGEARAGYLTNDINDSASLIRGDMTKFAADLTWTGWRKHSLLAGADYSLSGIETAAHRSPPLRPGQPPGPLATLVTNGHRDILGLVVQDQIEVGEKLGLTVGARYDSYSDLSSRVTPRVAIVWRATEHHILKSQYAEGFRPPTFFEFYQQVAPGVVPRYPFEVNATTELNYVYRGSNRVGRVTLFRSELTDLIRPGGVTSGDATAKGFELEWSQQLVPSLKVMANASHNTTHDARSPALDHQNSVSARWMGNVAVLYHAQPNLLLSSRWNYVGDRAGGPGYDLFDFTISRTDLVAPGLSLRAGIKDAFNSRPTYLQQPPVGPVNTTTYPGRSAWIEVSWKR